MQYRNTLISLHYAVMKWRDYMITKRVVASVVCALSLMAHAERITIYNGTNYTLCAAVYYEHTDQYRRSGETRSIPTNSSLVIDRPVPVSGASRALAIDYQNNLLTDAIDRQEWSTLVHKSVDRVWEKTFYIKRINGILKLYNPLEWHIIQPAWNLASGVYTFLMYPFQDVADTQLSAIVHNPYKDRGAFVRESNTLHPGEKQYQHERFVRIKKTLQAMSLLSSDAHSIPIMSGAFSGGGMRASLATVGFLSGLEKIGLLDAMMYGAFISGSAWSYASWCAYGGTLEEHKNRFIRIAQKGIVPRSAKEIELMAQALLVKVVMDQPISVADLFGVLLGNLFFEEFGDQRHRVYMSHSTQRVRDAQMLFPVYAAIRAEPLFDPMWYEFTPYEVGGAWLGKYAPTWAFGRMFVDGASCDYAPEQSLGSILGMLASIFAAQAQEIYQDIEPSISSSTIKDLLQSLLKPIYYDRLTSAEMRNFSAGLYKQTVPNLEILRLADAGSEPGFNFPYPLLSPDRPERSADLIIFFDMTVSGTRGQDLLSAQKYAHDHGYPFPSIDLSTIGDKAVALFKGETPQTPSILYVSLWNEKALLPLLEAPEYAQYKQYVEGFDITTCAANGPCDIFNFTYKPEQAQQLMAMAEFNVVAHKDLLLQLLKSIGDDKNKGAH
jgi:hypothetical protein